MEFVDRPDELKLLTRAWKRGLVVIWGRRRVGKTRLLLEWSARVGGTYTVADQSGEAAQRRYFTQEIARRLPELQDAVFPDWRSLLWAIAGAARRARFRGPIILDELPYLVQESRALPSVLQAWVDGPAKDARLLVVIAGSAQHMMQGLTMGADAPLYGRAVALLPVVPMEVGALAAALGLRVATDAIRAYAAWGGIPRYWELVEPYGRDLEGAVADVVLDPRGVLHREPDRLLSSELPSAVALRPVLDAIGGGAHRVSEIAGRLGQPATSLGGALARLQELELVARQQPFGAAERGGKRSLYRIADPFFRMWFRVVAPRRAELAVGDRRGRIAILRRFAPGLVSECWEELCRRAIPRLGAPGGVLRHLGPLGPASRYWHGNGPEWDVVARSGNEATVLGEVKWHEGRATDAMVEGCHGALLAKGPPPFVRPGSSVRHVVFVPFVSGKFKKPGSPITVVDADDVVAALE